MEMEERVGKLENKVNDLALEQQTLKVTVPFLTEQIKELKDAIKELANQLKKNDLEHTVNLAQLAKDNIIPLATLLVLIGLIVAKYFK